MIKLVCNSKNMTFFSILVPFTVASALYLIAKSFLPTPTPPNLYYIAYLILAVVLVTISCVLNRNAFVKCKIDNSGVSNKYISIDWQSINSFKEIDAGIAMFKLERFIVIGEATDIKFNKLDPRKCVFIPKNPQTIEAIVKTSAGKTDAFDGYRGA